MSNFVFFLLAEKLSKLVGYFKFWIMSFCSVSWSKMLRHFDCLTVYLAFIHIILSIYIYCLVMSSTSNLSNKQFFFFFLLFFFVKFTKISNLSLIWLWIVRVVVSCCQSYFVMILLGYTKYCGSIRQTKCWKQTLFCLIIFAWDSQINYAIFHFVPFESIEKLRTIINEISI